MTEEETLVATAGARSPSVEERVYTNVDKSEWGEGSWQDEPDKVQWKDEATGLPCLAKRHPSLGHWCGYVGLPPGHQFYEKDYDAVYDAWPGNWDSDDYLSVHGGLTYAAHCQHGDEAEAICHVPEPGEPDNVWWLGFDCAHSGDLSPGMRATTRSLGFPERDDHYRDLSYVRREVTRLAAQLALQTSHRNSGDAQDPQPVPAHQPDTSEGKP